MRHIKVKDLEGKLKINKECIADIIELIRISPIASRILLVLAVHVDKHNRIITTPKTLADILNMKISEVTYGIRKLAKEGFIDLEIVKLNHKQEAELVKHDIDLYYESKETIWEVISRERASKLDFTGRYLRITINSYVMSGTKNNNNRALINIKNALFFDRNLSNDEIISDGWI